MQKLTNSRQDEIDRTQFGFMGQAVQDHELYFGRLQCSPDGLSVPERGRVFPANDPKCRAKKTPRIDIFPIQHRREPSHLGAGATTLKISPLGGRQRFDIETAFLLSLEDWRPSIADAGNGGAKFTDGSWVKRYAHHDEPKHALGSSGKITPYVRSVGISPEHKPFDTSVIDDRENIVAVPIDGVGDWIPRPFAAAVTSNVYGQYGEVGLEVADVAGRVPDLTRLHAAVEEHDRGSGTGAFIGNAAAVAGRCEETCHMSMAF